MAHETISKTNEGRVSVTTTLTEMIDEAMATAARLNAVLERIEKTLGEPKKRVRYFVANGYTVWRENADGSISFRIPGHGPKWEDSGYVNYSALASARGTLIEIPAPEGEP